MNKTALSKTIINSFSLIHDLPWINIIKLTFNLRKKMIKRYTYRHYALMALALSVTTLCNNTTVRGVDNHCEVDGYTNRQNKWVTENTNEEVEEIYLDFLKKFFRAEMRGGSVYKISSPDSKRTSFEYVINKIHNDGTYPYFLTLDPSAIIRCLDDIMSTCEGMKTLNANNNTISPINKSAWFLNQDYQCQCLMHTDGKKEVRVFNQHLKRPLETVSLHRKKTTDPFGKKEVSYSIYKEGESPANRIDINIYIDATRNQLVFETKDGDKKTVQKTVQLEKIVEKDDILTEIVKKISLEYYQKANTEWIYNDEEMAMVMQQSINEFQMAQPQMQKNSLVHNNQLTSVSKQNTSYYSQNQSSNLNNAEEYLQQMYQPQMQKNSLVHNNQLTSVSKQNTPYYSQNQSSNSNVLPGTKEGQFNVQGERVNEHMQAIEYYNSNIKNLTPKILNGIEEEAKVKTENRPDLWTKIAPKIVSLKKQYEPILNENISQIRSTIAYFDSNIKNLTKENLISLTKEVLGIAPNKSELWYELSIKLRNLKNNFDKHNPTSTNK